VIEEDEMEEDETAQLVEKYDELVAKLSQCDKMFQEIEYVSSSRGCE
jgi:hypothetical protein